MIKTMLLLLTIFFAAYVNPALIEKKAFNRMEEQLESKTENNDSWSYYESNKLIKEYKIDRITTRNDLGQTPSEYYVRRIPGLESK